MKIVSAKNRDFAGSGGTKVLAPSAFIPSAEATAFLARTTGLDSTHQAAYVDLINGLVGDGVWSNRFDALYIFATQDSTTALLNLISSSYNGTSHGSPTFTADRGFTGVDSSSTVYIDTGFNPITAVSPKFTQNSAHLGVWLDSTARGSPAIGSLGSADCYVLGQYSGDSRFYFRVNSATAQGIQSSIQTANTANGFLLGNRSDASNMQGYKNGSSLTGGGSLSNAPQSLNLYALGSNNNGTPLGVGYQQSMACIGSSLTSTEEANLYIRLRTYMTTVGVP